MIRLFFTLLLMLFTATQVTAGERQKLGFGVSITNDGLADGRDRWRTGSFESSLAIGSEWTGQAPSDFGSLLEIRFNGEVISPESPANPGPLDRRYAQYLSLGLHTHFQRASIEYSVGVDVVVTGSQVGLNDVQEAIHDIIDGEDPSDAVLDAQVSNGVHAGVVIEAGRKFDIGRHARIRPFFEFRGGVETLARVGFDMTIGNYGRDGLLVRNPISGHGLSVIEDSPYRGLSLVLGADIAYVENSIFLSSGGPVQHTDTRARARAGLHYRTQAGTSIFYGITWLEEEFNTQDESQLVGSLQLRLKF